MSRLLGLMSREVGRELTSRKQLLTVIEGTRNVPKQNKNFYKYLINRRTRAITDI
jgi:hypothetical protein